jgi:hypothetical protein
MVKTVLSAMPTYFLTVFKIPNGGFKRSTCSEGVSYGEAMIYII